ncbi:MAG: lysophospholipid acyltransferase family protein [Granulosicoccaceae bacterium]
MPAKLSLIKLMLRSLALTPLSTQRFVGRQVGRAMFRWDKRSLRLSRRNISLCFPELDPSAQENLCRENLQHTGMAFTELACCYYWSPEKIRAIVQFDDKEVLEQALSEGKGVILASPHFGNWELTGQYIALLEHAMHVLYRPAKDAQTNAYIINRRKRLGTALLPTDASGVRGLSRALKQGEIIGILPDQEPDLDGGVFASFFGHQALTMTLLSKLARRQRTPVLLTYMRRTESGFAFQLNKLGDEIYNNDLIASAAALNAAIESLARSHPEQYIWNYKRFATQPEGQPKLY